MDSNQEYIQLEGLKFKYSGSTFGGGIEGSNHIKIKRTAFVGGPLRGNVYTFGIGPGSEYILLEDCWLYGPGGRQNLSIYQASKVIIRRVVLRHDHGWSNIVKSDPEGVGTVYESSQVALQNVIVLDSVNNPTNVGSEWVGAFTQANNNDVTIMQNNKVHGSMVINVEGNAFEHGGFGRMRDVQYEDVVVWWNAAVSPGSGGAISMNNPNTKSVSAQRMTIGGVEAAGSIWGGSNSSINIKNSIIFGITAFVFNIPNSGDGVLTHSFNNCFNNASAGVNCSSVGLVSSDPAANGLLYLPRIEASSTLHTSGEFGGRIGANITNRIGVNGSLWGDPGYDSLSAEPLWSWPYEDRIRADMRSAVLSGVNNSAKRGFAADGQTLTRYIWSALDNPTPSDISGITPPGTGQSNGFCFPLKTVKSNNKVISVVCL